MINNETRILRRASIDGCATEIAHRENTRSEGYEEQLVLAPIIANNRSMVLRRVDYPSDGILVRLTCGHYANGPAWVGDLRECKECESASK